MQRRNPCFGPLPVYPDLRTCHDWPLKTPLSNCQWGWKETRNALLVIRWVRWTRRCFTDVTNRPYFATEAIPRYVLCVCRHDMSFPLVLMWSPDLVMARWKISVDLFSRIFLADGPGAERESFLAARAGVAGRLARYSSDQHQISRNNIIKKSNV